MTRRPRLAAAFTPPPAVAVPAYDPAAHGVGIVHLGVGAFHRAHQAVYTDGALASGGDWRIRGVSLRGTAVADALNPQDGRYTLLTRDADGGTARVVASIAGVIAAARDRAAVLDALADPDVRVVSLTVTEKAYGIDRATGGVDPGHDAIGTDLADPSRPSGAIGLLVAGLRRRRAAGIPPFTVLCCDNLPGNGALLRGGVLDFAARAAPDLTPWIADTVAFPSTMVDRITPAVTPAVRDEVAAILGADDHAAVATEAFSQWVIEDDFSAGRPAWEAAGAMFVADVTPYETMKLRMLNGAHSVLGCAGFLAGHAYVRDAMADAALGRRVRRHFQAAAATLDPIAGFDFAAYATALDARFRNPAIAHETYQIAMDATEKLPQRWFAPATVALERGHDMAPFAFAVAAWMRYCRGRDDTGEVYALRDPREAEIAAAVSGATTAPELAAALFALPGLFPPLLRRPGPWRDAVVADLAVMLDRGMAAAIAAP